MFCFKKAKSKHYDTSWLTTSFLCLKLSKNKVNQAKHQTILMKKDTKTCKISSLCKETVVDFCNIQDTRKKVTSTEFKTIYVWYYVWYYLQLIQKRKISCPRILQSSKIPNWKKWYRTCKDIIFIYTWYHFDIILKLLSFVVKKPLVRMSGLCLQ